VDHDDPEKRIAELEGQLANSMKPPDQQRAAGLQPAGWFPDPGGAPLLRYWDGHGWTSATDIPPDVDTASAADETESSAGPQWSGPPGQVPANPAPAYPGYPGQPSPQPVEQLSDKKAAVAGTLQLFFGVFGAGRFYIGSWTIGACQLGLTILAFVLAQVVPETANTAVTLIGFVLIAVPIWAFVDAICMFIGTVRDGKGRKLR
jgi:TM2 domain-containing membrane protein YozV